MRAISIAVSAARPECSWSSIAQNTRVSIFWGPSFYDENARWVVKVPVPALFQMKIPMSFRRKLPGVYLFSSSRRTPGPRLSNSEHVGSLGPHFRRGDEVRERSQRPIGYPPLNTRNCLPIKMNPHPQGVGKDRSHVIMSHRSFHGIACCNQDILPVHVLR